MESCPQRLVLSDFTSYIFLPDNFAGFYLWKTVDSICVTYPGFNYEVLKSIFSYLACQCMCVHVRVRAHARMNTELSILLIEICPVLNLPLF